MASGNSDLQAAASFCGSAALGGWVSQYVGVAAAGALAAVGFLLTSLLILQDVADGIHFTIGVGIGVLGVILLVMAVFEAT